MSALFIENYIGESRRRIWEKIMDYTGRDLRSNTLKPLVDTGNENVRRILRIADGKKTAKSLLIEERRPTLNIHDKKVPWELFN